MARPYPAGGSPSVTTVAAAGASETFTASSTVETGAYDVTLTAPTCTVTVDGGVGGKRCVVELWLRQDTTGGREVAWPANVIWPTGPPPVLSPLPGRVDVVQLVTLDGGTTFYGSLVGSAFTTQAVPGAPTNLAVTVGTEELSLDWDVPLGSFPTVTGYKVYRGLSSGGETLLVSLGNVTTYVDTTAANPNEYFYRVAAVNSIGEGSLSNEASGVPDAGAAGDLPTVGSAPVQYFKADSLSLADGDPVSVWDDQSASAADATQGAGSLQPTFQAAEVNALPIVRFDGSNDKLVSAWSWIADGSTDGVTIFAVMKAADATGFKSLVASGGSNTPAVRTNADTVEVLLSNQLGLAQSPSVPTIATAFHVVTVAVAPHTFGSAYSTVIGVDGVEETDTTGASAQMIVSRPLVIGADQDTLYFHGDLATLVVYPTELDAGDRSAVVAFLQDKYGL